LGRFETLIPQQTPILPSDGATDPAQIAINNELDRYRILTKTKPHTALDLLRDLRENSWDQASMKTRFRIVTNIGAAYFELGDGAQAANYLIEAANFSQSTDDKAARNLAIAYLLKGNFEGSRKEAERAIALKPEEGDGYSILIPQRSPELTHPCSSKLTHLAFAHKTDPGITPSN